MDDKLINFLLKNINQEKEIIAGNYQLDKQDFKGNDKELKDKAISEIINSYQKTVHYTGKNNRVYSKECILSSKDIVIRDCRTLYYPEWIVNIKAVKKNYTISYYESAKNTLPVRNDTIICQVCNRKNMRNRWYCTFCGSIICKGHLKETRLDKVKICIKCSINKRFFGARKYFQSEEELKTFESYYTKLPLYKKIWENSYLVYFTVTTFIVVGLQYFIM